MVYAQTRIYPRKRNAQKSSGFCDTNGSPNLGQTTIPRDTQQQQQQKTKKKQPVKS